MADARQAEKKVSPAAIVIGLAVVAGAALFAWLTFGPQPPAADKPTLTEEAKEYRVHLQLSEVQPQTSESYIQRSLFEIIGKITNTGSRTVGGVQVNCVFRDSNRREIKRELVSVVSRKNSPLAPQATAPFRLAFDDIPDEWNHQMPDFVIASVAFVK